MSWGCVGNDAWLHCSTLDWFQKQLTSPPLCWDAALGAAAAESDDPTRRYALVGAARMDDAVRGSDTWELCRGAAFVTVDCSPMGGTAVAAGT